MFPLVSFGFLWFSLVPLVSVGFRWIPLVVFLFTRGHCSTLAPIEAKVPLALHYASAELLFAWPPAGHED